MLRSSMIIMLFLLMLSCIGKDRDNQSPYYVPSTVSAESQLVIRSFPKKAVEKELPGPDDLEGWNRYWEANEKIWLPFSDSLISIYQPLLRDTLLGGTPVIEIIPREWKHRDKVLIYLHGGAYTFFSARTMLMGALPVARITGLKIISVDYTNPPRLRYIQILEQVVAVIRALLASGYTLNDIGIYGDSAGGAMSAGTVLKMRDEGIGMPAVVVLISPWSDIAEKGDTYHTLKGQDPIIEYGNSLDESALAYAPAEEHENPYVSPVYGDYSGGFPPTLIQGGTKEIFVSNFVRHYQALDQAGIPVKLDLYEGMWHVFQEVNAELPESSIAHAKFRDWVYRYLEIHEE